jgi:hypothetical protein
MEGFSGTDHFVVVNYTNINDGCWVIKDFDDHQSKRTPNKK